MAEGLQTASATEQRPTDKTYSYPEAIEELESMNRELRDMMDTMLKTRVRAQIMESEMASLVNPEVAESLRTVQTTCKTCILAMKLQDYERSCSSY